MIKRTVYHLLLWTHFAVAAGRQGESVLSIEKFAECADQLNLPDRFTEIVIENVGKGKHVINGELLVTKRSTTLSGSLTVFRCRDRSGVGCEYFLTVPVADMCYKYVEKGQFWSSVFEGFRPTHKCPIEKRKYKMVNGTFDLGSFIKATRAVPGITEFSWKMKFEVQDENREPYHCSEFILRVYKSKVRS